MEIRRRDEDFSQRRGRTLTSSASVVSAEWRSNRKSFRAGRQKGADYLNGRRPFACLGFPIRGKGRFYGVWLNFSVSRVSIATWSAS